MKILKNYQQFNENASDRGSMFDKLEDESVLGVDKVIDILVKHSKSSKEVFEIKELIKKLSVNEGVVNESVLQNLKNWMDDKLFKYLINRKASFYTKLVDKLDIFDLTTLDDIFKHYPGFTKLHSMYLAGGMDEAEDTGKGWRTKLEDQFGEDHIIEDDTLVRVIKDPRVLSEFSYPVLLNPVRKEVDRNKSLEFDNAIGSLKDPDYNPLKHGEAPVNYFKKTFAKSIEPDDEHLLRISDAVFLGQDRAAGAGTYGELELLSLSRKPLFCWLINKSAGKMGEVKLWTIPTLSKVMLNEDDMKTFVKTLKKYV